MVGGRNGVDLMMEHKQFKEQADRMYAHATQFILDAVPLREHFQEMTTAAVKIEAYEMAGKALQHLRDLEKLIGQVRDLRTDVMANALK